MRPMHRTKHGNGTLLGSKFDLLLDNRKSYFLPFDLRSSKSNIKKENSDGTRNNFL